MRSRQVPILEESIVNRAWEDRWFSMLEPDDRAVHIYDDICLQEICRGHSLYGISPIRYLKILRLNRVREALRACARSATVFDIAADHGFWHMGHFSAQYRALFGETPSQTLRVKSASGSSD